MSTTDTALLTTPLNALHIELGARMVPFAGYSMPVQYPAGLMAEHHHTRNAAGLFDVSHMGQLRLVGPDAAGFSLERVSARPENAAGSVTATPLSVSVKVTVTLPVPVDPAVVVAVTAVGTTSMATLVIAAPMVRLAASAVDGILSL